MADSRYLLTAFWSDEFISDNLDTVERLVYIYFLTNDKTNIAGIYQISVSKMSFETGVPATDIKKILRKCEDAHKVYYYKGFLVISNFIKNQRLNDNMVTGIIRIMESLPDHIKLYIKDKIILNNTNRHNQIKNAIIWYSNGSIGLPNPSQANPNPSRRGKGEGEDGIWNKKSRIERGNGNIEEEEEFKEETIPHSKLLSIMTTKNGPTTVYILMLAESHHRGMGLDKEKIKKFAHKFFHHYDANGWTHKNGTPISDWKKVAMDWVIKDMEKLK